ncbi:MAG TPA: N-acyl-D-aspartate deacylase [Ruminococcaceae bacterium]|nr:N-acyl-D-aspartate deacylase [Oscillospiraceae bacterium]
MYDLVIRNGTLADGTRSQPRRADLCIRDGRIAGIADRYDGEAGREIDAAGKIVAPGFIDIHSHSDPCALIRDFVPQAKLYQGITLEITGNCGISCLPNNDAHRDEISRYFSTVLGLPLGSLKLADDSVSDFAQRVSKDPPATNYGVLIGHGTLRGSVMGFGMRDPTPGELEEMKETLDRELSRGAFGMSLGLIYPPSSFGKMQELVELSKVLKKHEAILSVHMRNEGPRIFEALDEMIQVAGQSGVHLQISHLKLMGKPQWGRAAELLQKVEDARRRGLNITCDQYPYTATSTGLSALCPKWAHDGGTDQLVERLKNPSEQLLREIGQEMENRGGPEAVLVTSTMDRMPEANGKTIREVSEKLGCSPAQAVAKCLVQCRGGVCCNYFCLNAEDMLAIMKDLRISVGSDGVNYPYDPEKLRDVMHPRNFGTFPRFLQTVRENHLMPVQDAVYKMTGLSASILGLKERGVLQVGKAADITIFDYETVEDCATYVDSMVKPKGIEHVLVRGIPVLSGGKATDARPGAILLHGNS